LQRGKSSVPAPGIAAQSLEGRHSNDKMYATRHRYAPGRGHEKAA